MRSPLLAACMLALGAGACGRIGYDVVAAIGGGGRGGGGGSAVGGAGTGGGGGTAGTGGTVGSAGTGGGTAGSAGGGTLDGGGDGGVVTLDGGSCADAAAPCGSVRVQYHAGDLNKPTDPWIRPQINLYNDSSADVPLSELVVRYWYTIDTVAPQVFSCDTAFVAGACGSVTGTFAAVSPPRTGADSVLEIGFLPAAGTLVAGGQTQAILTRVNKTDFSNYDEPGDYSYDAASSAFADAPRITVYRNGALVWGVEPP